MDSTTIKCCYLRPTYSRLRLGILIEFCDTRFSERSNGLDWWDGGFIFSE